MNRAEKERQIMQAAEELFTTRRFHEVKMDDICRAAGVGKGTIYRYFKDKDDLFFRLVTSGFEELCDRVRARIAGGEDFENQLRGVLTEIRSQFFRRRPLFRMMHSEEARLAPWRGAMRERLNEHREELLRLVSGLLQRGIDAGVLRRDLSPQMLAGALLAMHRGALWQLEEGAEPESATRLVVDIFLRGAAAPSRGDG